MRTFIIAALPEPLYLVQQLNGKKQHCSKVAILFIKESLVMSGTSFVQLSCNCNQAVTQSKAPEYKPVTLFGANIYGETLHEHVNRTANLLDKRLICQLLEILQHSLQET